MGGQGEGEGIYNIQGHKSQDVGYMYHMISVRIKRQMRYEIWYIQIPEGLLSKW